MTAFSPKTVNESVKLNELLATERNIAQNYDQALKDSVQVTDSSVENPSKDN